MNWQDWYTDTVDVWRVSAVMDGSLSRYERKQISAGNPCRIYQSGDRAISMTQTASDIKQEDKLACGLAVEIQAGDELLIHRGGGLGKAVATIRAFAAYPNYYFEPFGAIVPGLAHQEIRLLQQERVKGGVQGDAEGTGGTTPCD